jgi:hypothetical protein
MINQFKSPRDKIIILINFVYILNKMINDNNKKKPSGADEVFPIVVYAILKSGIKKLKSNMKYIKTFRHYTRLESIEEYYFTTITSAIEFIENIKIDHLAYIEKNEFQSLCESIDKKIIKKTLLKSEKKNFIKFLLNFLLKYLLLYIYFFIFYLSNFSLGNQHEISLLNFLYSSRIQETDPIELIEINQNINLNTDSVISKHLIIESFENNLKNFNPIFSVDLDKLYKEYFTGDFIEFNVFKLEKMFNDFKLLLILINNYKKKAKFISIDTEENLR